MRINEIFTVGDILQSVGGVSELLNRDNCKIESKSKSKDESAVIFCMKRQFDGEVGSSYLRVREEFSEIANQLLTWALGNEKFDDLTLNELTESETDLQINSSSGRMSLKD
jgi:formyltetrahydrofolate hydrolase